MIGNVYTEAARANWATVPGRAVDGVYDANGNPTKLTFSEDTNVVYAQYFTYDANGNPIKIECKAQ
jgi:hypothetical protein